VGGRCCRCCVSSFSSSSFADNVVPHQTRTAPAPTLRCGGACRTLKKGRHGSPEGASPLPAPLVAGEGGGGGRRGWWRRGCEQGTEVAVGASPPPQRCCTSLDLHCACAGALTWRSRTAPKEASGVEEVGEGDDISKMGLRNEREYPGMGDERVRITK
jgi:hypothetical protein